MPNYILLVIRKFFVYKIRKRQTNPMTIDVRTKQKVKKYGINQTKVRHRDRGQLGKVAPELEARWHAETCPLLVSGQTAVTKLIMG